MSSLIGQGGRALVLRLVLAEILAKRGQGPLAPRFTLFCSRADPRASTLARTSARFDAVRPRDARVHTTESTSTPAGQERA